MNQGMKRELFPNLNDQTERLVAVEEQTQMEKIQPN